MNTLPKDVLLYLLNHLHDGSNASMCVKPIVQLVCKQWKYVTKDWSKMKLFAYNDGAKEWALEVIQTESLFRWYLENVTVGNWWCRRLEFIPISRFSLDCHLWCIERLGSDAYIDMDGNEEHFRDYFKHYHNQLFGTPNLRIDLIVRIIHTNKHEHAVEQLKWCLDQKYVTQQDLESEFMVERLLKSHGQHIDEILNTFEACVILNPSFYTELEQMFIIHGRQNGLEVVRQRMEPQLKKLKC